MLAIHNFSELKSLAYNAKIRSSPDTNGLDINVFWNIFWTVEIMVYLRKDISLHSLTIQIYQNLHVEIKIICSYEGLFDLWHWFMSSQQNLYIQCVIFFYQEEGFTIREKTQAFSLDGTTEPYQLYGRLILMLNFYLIVSIFKYWLVESKSSFQHCTVK